MISEIFNDCQQVGYTEAFSALFEKIKGRVVGGMYTSAIRYHVSAATYNDIRSTCDQDFMNNFEYNYHRRTLFFRGILIEIYLDLPDNAIQIAYALRKDIVDRDFPPLIKDTDIIFIGQRYKHIEF